MRMRGCCMCARALSCIHCATLSHLPPIHVHRLRKYLGLARLLPTTRSRTPRLFSPILRRFAFSSAASFFFLSPCVHALFRSLINQKQANLSPFLRYTLSKSLQRNSDRPRNRRTSREADASSDEKFSVRLGLRRYAPD